MDNRSFVEASYRGFLVKVQPVQGIMFLERGGMRLQNVNSLHEGLEAIERLTTWNGGAK
jgi:hypothetical protein